MTARLPELEQISTDKPSAARMYDYLLGGYHNFAVDRAAAERVIAIYPNAILDVRDNRAFLGRSVRFSLAEGIDQLLDMGSGIPTAGNVHEIAQAVNPAARVVYVEIDPIAVAHSRALLQGNPNTAVIQGDAALPAPILASPEARRLLDFSKPIAVLLVAVLHFITDDDIALRTVRALRDSMTKGSTLAICHASYDGISPETIAQIEALYARSTAPVKARSRLALSRFFEGFEMIPPGLCPVSRWQPDQDDAGPHLSEPSIAMCGVGRKL